MSPKHSWCQAVVLIHSRPLRPKPLMPLTPKPTFTQASRPDKSPSSVLSSTLVAVPQLLPTPCLGSPWRVTAPQHPQALEGRSILALPSMQSLLEAGRPRRRPERRLRVPAGYLSPIDFIPRLLAHRGSLFLEVGGRLQLRSPQCWWPEASYLCPYGVAPWHGAATSSPLTESPPYCSRALHFAY